MTTFDYLKVGGILLGLFGSVAGMVLWVVWKDKHEEFRCTQCNTKYDSWHGFKCTGGEDWHCNLCPSCQGNRTCRSTHYVWVEGRWEKP